MGRRGYVQKRHAEHDTSVSLSDWGQGAAAAYLEELGLNIRTESEVIGSSNADKWEIELPWTSDGDGVRVDWSRMEKIVQDLRSNPSLVTSDEGTEFGDDLAELLDAGLKAAKEHGYNWIIVDFW